MTRTPCARCGAPLHPALAGDPCPSCGAPTGRVSEIVRRALGELATLPDDEAGAVVQQLLRVAGRIEGRATLSGALAVVHQLAGRVEGEATLSGEPTVVHQLIRGELNVTLDPMTLSATGAVAAVDDVATGVLVRRAPPWSLAESVRRHPVLWWLLGTLAAPHVEKLSREVVRQLVAVIAPGHLDLASPPAIPDEPPPPPAIVQPAPRPLADICLPPGEPARK